MKTIINTFRAIQLIACIIVLCSGEGTAGNNTNLQRYGAVGFSIGNKGYMGTGTGNFNTTPYKKDFWEYDPATNSWTQKADFGGTEREFAVGFSIGSLGYIGTGYNASGRLQDFWQYNPTSNTWTQKADFIGAGRYAAAGFSISAKGYLGTGIHYVNGTTYTWYKDFYEYDPVTGIWTRKPDVGGLARAFCVGLSIGNKGYIGTGYPGGLSKTKEFWEYDPNTEIGGTWTQKADFAGEARDCAAGFSIGTKGYLGTGLFSTGVYYKDFWEYDQSKNIWTQKTDFGSRHKGPLKETLIAGNDLNDVSLVIYPNPAISVFKCKLQSGSDEMVNIKILDMMGRLVREYKSLPLDGLLTFGDDLNPGIYIAVVIQGEFRKSVKITKVN